MPLAWACEITRENKQVIASENPYFDDASFEEWVSTYKGDGYFVRDDVSPFDCKYMDPVVFLEIYRFKDHLVSGGMFRQIEKI